jgi:hypothetical protein
MIRLEKAQDPAGRELKTQDRDTAAAPREAFQRFGDSAFPLSLLAAGLGKR